MTSAGGVDRRQLKALLRAYFVLSTRSMPVGITGAKRVRTLPFILFIYGLLGFVIGAMAPMLDSTFLFALFVHMMTFFVVGTMALNEAAEVLFNARDADILGFRPVNGPTLVLAKGLTILGFCGLMAVAVNLGPTILGFLCKDARGWFAPVHFLSVAIETVFLCATVVCSYGLIARFLGPERFQRLVTAAQILSTLMLVVGFQVLPRIASKMDAHGFLETTPLVWALPMTWFAAIDVALASTSASTVYAVGAAAGVTATLLLAWIGVLRLPANAAVESRASAAPVTPAPARKAELTERSSGWSRWRLWTVWMPDVTERAVFRLCVTYLLRDRALKVRLAAGLAYFIVFPLLILINEDHTGIMPVMLVWMLGIVPLSAIEMMRLSSTPEGAELFLFAPVAEPAALFHGARKAALVCVVFPLAVWSVTIATWALRETPEKLLVVLPGLFLIAPMSLVPGLRGDFVPFSQAVRSGERAAQVLAVFLTMVPMGIVAVGVFLAQKFGFVHVAIGGVLVVAAALHFGLSKWVRTRSSKALRR
ncbi:MAG: hypothetical protein HZA53_19170 [Planctomycetes bacterium]|nr:hypothetical protein [Planctomycetota bacterium]